MPAAVKATPDKVYPAADAAVATTAPGIPNAAVATTVEAINSFFDASKYRLHLLMSSENADNVMISLRYAPFHHHIVLFSTLFYFCFFGVTSLTNEHQNQN